MIDGAKEGFTDSKKNIDAVKSGKYTVFSKEYWTSQSNENNDDSENSLSTLGKVFGFVSRYVQAPIAMLGYIGTKVKNTFTDMIDNVKDLTKKNDEIIDKAENGKISVFSADYWKMDNVKDNPLGIIGLVASYIQRLVNAPIILIKGVLGKIKDKFSGMVDWFKDLFTDNSSDNKSGTGKLDSGSGHAYQSNPLYKDMKYGDSTIAASGCAPVAATNIINRFNNGGSGDMTVGRAAKYAESHNMTVPGGGTNINYFNSFLNSNGIATSNTSSKNKVMNAVNNGDQVVMLGKDSFNGPNAPFGTNPHFITAVGANGNQLLIEDPDLPNGVVSYDKNKVLNSMSSSVIASNKIGKARRRVARGRRNLISKMKSGMGKLYYGLGTQLGADAIIAIAESQVGTAESPANSGNVKYNTAYWGHPVSGNFPWCCTFVWWVFNQAGASALFNGGEKTAYCPTLMSYYRANGQSIDKNADPEPGDIVFFNWNGKSNAQHVGIVAGVDGDKIITIEGNTSNSNNANGGSVMKRVRSRNCIIGFARPHYPYEYDSSTVIDMSKYNDSTDYKSMASSGSSTNGSTTGTITSQLSSLGTSIIKAMYGDNAYNALYGNNSESNTDDLANNSTNLTGSNDKERIWNWLTKTKGLSSKAAAGIMGCWEAESKNSSSTIEGQYYAGFPGFDAVAKDGASANAWAKLLFKHYDKDGIGYNKSGYLANDGNYYPGFGLAQWTGSRAYNLLQYGKNNNSDWKSLKTQLSFVENENGKFDSLKDKLADVSSPTEAAKITLDNYEMNTSGYADSHPSAFNNRAANAENIYKQMSGSGRADHGMSRANSYGGSAVRALNSRIRSGGAGSAANATAYTNTSYTSGVDYGTFLQTIVSVLMSIADNTALLNKILSILSDNFNINIDKSDIEAASTKTKAQTEAALNQLVQRSSGNNVNVSKLLNNKDTEYILAAMKAIATE